ncbi:hypothetical protein TVAGG3_0802530 [Trichomonas vaginalis G3]|uniref:uncharacterized protein n=1 Tax=Trichomonas vaginalis (strain ATCC PRA-98 / G3) TaxID=412133 RepID=UPI002156DD8D|nr:uncharacterized protein TVAGG3_1089030 [Trichomonas vaginalis G3]XP_051082884.1 hypothetical protein TVAGG3_0802530 [Trichomonas vaginalis G3]KAI5482310.1 hypothetical protein TVAGG3_1089030 [Trichomonas vaginalis G3]KAI5496607.1 hypothetical protein TVAGG3_0802530 [Trichomonas vaginalis G3]
MARIALPTIFVFSQQDFFFGSCAASTSLYGSDINLKSVMTTSFLMKSTAYVHFLPQALEEQEKVIIEYLQATEKLQKLQDLREEFKSRLKQENLLQEYMLILYPLLDGSHLPSEYTAALDALKDLRDHRPIGKEAFELTIEQAILAKYNAKKRMLEALDKIKEYVETF